ncbi:TIR domain-containing protein [Paraburkholderia phenoliruptrix]|uniref:TIR domain-containing protein n=1 Tax=Paraburkholderia phenoliruptrix TaxID=252970 RepID=UPI003D96A106
MAKRVFFSFHYQDVVDFRANVVRNHWVAKEDREEAGFFDASIWEESKKKGDADLKKLIHEGLDNTSTTCVLIGSQTYARRWVRYEIFRSIYRANKTFGVHINQIKGKDQQVKVNGPNPFDYLALRYSADGASVQPMEAENGKWVVSSTMPSYALKNTAGDDKRGRTIQLSQLGFRTYCWSADKGYESFATWVG